MEKGVGGVSEGLREIERVESDRENQRVEREANRHRERECV